MLQSLFQYETEMRRFRAVAIGIGAFIVMPFEGIPEKHVGILNVFSDLGQIIDL
ncbi:hypothetical protein D3C87_1724360 [compost metagenome]